MIKKCGCYHKWQNEKYGDGMRVVNPLKAGGFRCTACGKTLSLVVDKKKGVK